MHRYSFIIHKGKIPKGLWVLHTCDNHFCVNPKHLYAGTALNNSNDVIERKGGLINGRRKLTPELAAAMKSEYREGKLNKKQLSEKYNLHVSATCNLLNGKTYKNIK